MTVEITQENFDSLLSEKEVLVVDFWAPWCGPCKTLGPIVELVGEENEKDNVQIAKINVDLNPDLAKQYGVRSIPTILFFKNGEEVKKTVGFQSKKTIEGIIDEIS